mgnify:CR=1 FL=1
MRHTLARQLALLALAAAPALAQSETEPNNTIAQANGPFTVPSSISGTMSSFSDVDYFRIVVPHAMRLRISTRPGAGFNCTNQDLTLRLRDAGGVELAYNDDADFYCPMIDYPANVNATVPAGTYYVQVNSLTPMASTYVLHVEQFFATGPVSTAITYQGILSQDGQPASGPHDFRFSLWTHPTANANYLRRGTGQTFYNIDVEQGLVQLPVDFGADAFDGTQVYLQVEVTPTGEESPNWRVLERRPITPAPMAQYAFKSVAAQTATLAENATLATTANYAYSAGWCQQADTANSAGTANTATTAQNVSWSGVNNKPSGFADGIDHTGGWTEISSITTTNHSVGIGTSSPGSFLLAVNGSAAKVGGGTWSIFCDSRLKHDIEPLSGTLDRLLQLHGYTFEYNTEAVENRLALPGRQIGLMADEVERVFPDWVERDGQGYRYVTERATTALMVEALRDLRREKDEAIAQLKAQNDALEARLKALERSATK